MRLLWRRDDPISTGRGLGEDRQKKAVETNDGKIQRVVRLVRRDLQSVAVDDVEIDKLVALLLPGE